MENNLTATELCFIQDLYFKWICSVAFPNETDRSLYVDILRIMHSIEFKYRVTLDENRLIDGINLRYHFSCSCHLPYELVASYFDNHTCSFLEMMVALAKRCEDDFMSDLRYGDRTSVWFRMMFNNLGLYNQTANVEDIIYRCINRQYNPDGSNGGLFIYNPKEKIIRYGDSPYIAAKSLDFRIMQLWDQMLICMNDFGSYEYDN